jgi:hypothetical protein
MRDMTVGRSVITFVGVVDPNDIDLSMKAQLVCLEMQQD